MSRQIRPTMGAAEWSMLILLSALWGGSFFFVELALDGFQPFTVVFVRVALSAMVLWTVIAIAGLAVPHSTQTWLAFLGMGALNNAIPFSFIVWAQTEISGSLASILNATTPLFALVVAHVLTRDERLTGARLAGVTIGFAGTAVIIGPQIPGNGAGAAMAQLAILCAALSYSFAGVFGRRFQEISPLVTAAGQVTCSSLLMAPVALVAGRPWNLPPPSLPAVGALILVAVLSTALAYILYFRILASAGATNLLLVTFLVPVSAMLLGIPLLGENLALADIAGMLLIASGLAVIDGRPARLLQNAVRGCRDIPVH